MVKKLLIVVFIFNIYSYASSYEQNCVACHEKMIVSIDKYFYRYLLKYSSEKNVKSSLYEYLKNPSKDKTIMPDAFIKRYGIKGKSNLNDEELKKAIDEYWEIYKVFGKLE